MNEFYSQAQAKDYLRQVLTGGISASANQMTSMADIDVQGISFQTVQHPPSDRMIRTEDSEELILTIQGVLCSSTLPPIPANRRYSSAPAAVRNLRQFVQITGFGLPEFDQAVDKIHQIQESYESFDPTNTVRDVNFTPYEGHKTFEAYARYFTDRYLVPTQKNIPLSRLVDPHGVLERLKPDSFIHAEDNEVEYCKLIHLGEGGNNKYASCDPKQFKAGDVVEVAFTCFAIPSKDDRRCFLVNLKAVTLLCDLFRKQADRKSKEHRASAARTIPVRTSKRRCLYVSDSNEGVQDAEAGTTPALEFTVDRRLRAPNEGNAVIPTMDVDF